MKTWVICALVGLLILLVVFLYVRLVFASERSKEGEGQDQKRFD